MTDIIKIISSADTKSRLQSTLKSPATDAAFEIEASIQPDGSVESVLQSGTDRAQSGERHDAAGFNMRPLFEHTKACADGIRRLVLYCKLFLQATDVVDEEFFDRLFLLPSEAYEEILRLDEGASAFRGDFFEALRAFSNREEFHELRTPILAILKHFDCFVQRRQTLDYICVHTESLAGHLQETGIQSAEKFSDIAKHLMTADSDLFQQGEVILKQELIPQLHMLAKQLPPAHPLQGAVRLLMHYIVRYDRSNPALLDKSYSDFSQALTVMLPQIDPDDLEGLKSLLIESSDELKEKMHASDQSDDIVTLIRRAIDKEAPAKLNAYARALLINLIQNESPSQPLLHFILPLRFRDEDVYAEFYVDKDSKKTNDTSSRSVNILFTIQSDAFGTFEVDLVAHDRAIDLSVKAPEALVNDVRSLQAQIRSIIESSGCRLRSYRADRYIQSETILKQFPQLRHRKVGLNVRI